jgi:hypothetical protein
MKTIYLTLIIGILLMGIAFAGVSLLPRTDITIKLDRYAGCQAKVTIDDKQYKFNFNPTDTDIKISRDKALKLFLQQDIFMDRIDAKNLKSLNITSTICGGIETLGEGKVTLTK